MCPFLKPSQIETLRACRVKGLSYLLICHELAGVCVNEPCRTPLEQPKPETRKQLWPPPEAPAVGKEVDGSSDGAAVLTRAI